MSERAGAPTTGVPSARGNRSWKVWRRKVVTAVRLRPRDALAALHALGLAVTVECLLRLVPLPRLARMFRVHLGTIPPGRATPAVADQLPTFTRHERRRFLAAHRIMRNWPFGKGRCLRSSLVVGRMLAARQPVLRVGVEHRADGIEGHAWLEIDGHAVLSDRGAVPFHDLSRHTDQTDTRGPLT